MDLVRSSGLLLHISSLPSPYGIGDLGPAAYAFADFLTEAKQQVWQVLPVVPVGKGDSPYASPSTFAGNPLLISPDVLLENGQLLPEDLTPRPSFPNHVVAFEEVVEYKTRILERAFDHFESRKEKNQGGAFESFSQKNAWWLDDYALFMALSDANQSKDWTQWPAALAQREAEAISSARKEYGRVIKRHQYWQFLFDQQWSALHSYCAKKDIQIMGDIPIYVAHESADVWANASQFILDEDGQPSVVAGVPPDYFSETGQRWGNPLYNWDEMENSQFSWWIQRIRRALSLYDLVRLDHFRGFSAYWEIPAEEETAVNGRWVSAPGSALFNSALKELEALPLLAENLGIITPDVTELMNQFDLPGMAVLQFGFDGDASSEHLPHNYDRNLIVYTGTHDNDTLVGWWSNSSRAMDSNTLKKVRAASMQYVNMDEDQIHDLPWYFMRALYASVANLVIIPVQDVLGLGSRARMNTPGTESGNWRWRLLPDQLQPVHAKRLKPLVEVYGRDTLSKVE